MQITLAREPSANGWTLGRLGVDGRFECYTCEDVVRPPDAPKVPGQTAIPPGRYRVIITLSPRFGVRLPRLIGVTGFEGILIHTGNTARDTDGCILPGLDHNLDGVRQSRPAFDALMQKIQTALSNGRQVWLEVFSRATRQALPLDASRAEPQHQALPAPAPAAAGAPVVHIPQPAEAAQPAAAPAAAVAPAFPPMHETGAG